MKKALVYKLKITASAKIMQTCVLHQVFYSKAAIQLYVSLVKFMVGNNHEKKVCGKILSWQAVQTKLF